MQYDLIRKKLQSIQNTLSPASANKGASTPLRQNMQILQEIFYDVLYFDLGVRYIHPLFACDKTLPLLRFKSWPLSVV